MSHAMHTSGNRPAHLSLRRLAFALAAGSLASFAAAAPTLPTGMQVTAGQASAVTNGSQLTITNSNGAILNWNSFSIGASNAVNFVQPSSTSQVLNRVTGTDPSQILGSLSSNGKVWLLNPNGVLFGQGARLDVAGLVTSTLNLNDQDWLAGRYVFSSSDASNPAASIVNQGEIRSSAGGQVFLLAGAGGVRNEGLIETQGGQIVLAAGSSIELLDTATPRVTVKVSAPAGEVLNLGQLSAAGGRIDVQAATVNQQGIVRADSLSTGPAGEIVMNASERLTLAAGSTTSANGTGSSGGNIELLGKQVALLDGAAVTANGSTGGGTVLVGGGAQGKDASVPNSDAVYFGQGASISADATQAGDGGHIVLWSNSATRAYGSLSATGGAQTGNGGLIETSGGWLDARPSKIDVSAANGKAGTWLLDPYDLLITDSTSDTGTDPSFTANADNATVSSATLISALNSGSNVTVQTSTDGFEGSQGGTITVSNANILVTAATPGSLTLIADRDINVSNSVISSQSPMAVSLMAGRTFNGGITLTDSSIASGGGDITLGGFGFGNLAEGGNFFNAASNSVGNGVTLTGTGGSTLDAGVTGNITIAGVGAATGSRGVFLDSGSILKGNLITIDGSADSGEGVLIAGSSLASKGSMEIDGFSTLSVGVSVTGISLLKVSPDVYTGNFNELHLQGTSQDTASGVQVTSAGSQLTAGNYTSLNITGSNTDGGSPTVALSGGIDASQGYDMNINTLNEGSNVGSIVLNHATVSGSYSGVNITNAGSLSLQNTQIAAQSNVQLFADNVTFGVGTSVTNNYYYSGDAILIEGNSGNPLTTFVNNAGAGALVLNNGGRWIIYAQDVTNASQFQPGALAYDFVRHGAVDGSSTWADDNGNGYVSAASQTTSGAVTGTVLSKTYDGTITATVDTLNGTAPSYGGGTAQADASSATAHFDTKDAGTGKTVTLDSATFTDSQGKAVYGVTISSSNLQNADITPALVTVTPVVADKVYNAGTDASISASFSGLIGSETLTATTISGAFLDKNVGTGKPVQGIQFSFGDGSNGGLASNYSVSYSSSATGNITPATLLLSGLTANNKIYDAGLVASLGGTASVTPLGSDSVTLVGTASGSFADKNVGTAKPVSVSGLTLGGTDGGNYLLAAPSSLTADITPATLLVTGISASNKVYDTTTVATLNGLANVTALSTDMVTLSGTPLASFADKNVGTGKSVLVSGLSLSGPDAGNYVVSAPLTANITPATLVVSGLTASNKVYDTTTTATLAGSASVSALSGDTVTLSGTAAGSFADKNVGTAKSVAVSGLSLSGTDGGNYVLSEPGLAADITPATLVVSGLSAGNKVYDATTVAALSGSGSVSALAGDVVTLAGTPVGNFVDKNVGTGKSVLVSGYTLGGTDGGNYVVSAPGVTANITPASLSISGLTAGNKVYDATTAATLGGVPLVTPLAGDALSLGGSPSASFADKNVGNEKSVLVSGFSLSGPDGGNYTLVMPSLSANITPATLTYVANAASKLVDDPLPALSGSVSGFVGGETQGSATTGTLGFTTPATATSPIGSYAVNGSGLSAQNYQFVQASGNATALSVQPSGTQVPPPPPPPPPPPAPDTATQQTTTVALISTTRTATSTNSSGDISPPSRAPAPITGLLDLTPQNTGPSNSAALAAIAALPTPSFNATSLSSMSMDTLALLLASRNWYMQAILADSVKQLQVDPSLADLPVCQSLKDAETGTCLVTDDLKRQAQGGSPEAVAQAASPAAAAAAKAGGGNITPAPKPAGAATPAGTHPATTPAVMVAAVPQHLPAIPSWLSPENRRRIKSAALPQIERKIAVVIGVDDYGDNSIPKLDNAVNDAEAVGKVFETRLGYETDVLPNATKASVIATLNRLALTVGPKDSVVIYYAGHGDLVEAVRQGYWLLADADAKRPQTWLSNADIGRLIAQIGASQVALISDSCYSGSLVSDERIRASATPPDPAQLLLRKSVVVMSSGGNEPVSDLGKEGHSPFTWNLLNQLGQVNSWQPGGNIFERVRFAVARELPQRPQYGASSAAGHQAGGDYLFEQRQLDPATR